MIQAQNHEPKVGTWTTSAVRGKGELAVAPIVNAWANLSNSPFNISSSMPFEQT